MNYTCRPSQILELSVQVEEEGILFYKMLANHASDEKTKKILQFLSGQETQHCRMFREIAEVISHNEPTQEYSVDVFQLLQVSVQNLRNHIFDLKQHAREAPIDLKKSLNTAVRTEKEAIHVYTEMRNAFGKQFHEVLSRIIDEEAGHLQMLLTVLERVTL